MTFSDKRVAEAVNKTFVAAWVNRGPGFRNLNFSTESWIFQSDLEAYPTKNICTFFLSPQGKVFYYVAGSYSPEVFLQVIETAAALRGELFDAAMQQKGGTARKIHAFKEEEYETLREKAEEAYKAPDGWRALLGVPKTSTVSYRGLKHKHNARCAWSLGKGYAYFAALHREMAGWDVLPDLETVRYSYVYGNDFTEESDAATRIAKPDPSAKPPTPLPPPPPKTAKTPGKGGSDGFGLGLPGINLGPLQPE